MRTPLDWAIGPSAEGVPQLQANPLEKQMKLEIEFEEIAIAAFIIGALMIIASTVWVCNDKRVTNAERQLFIATNSVERIK